MKMDLQTPATDEPTPAEKNGPGGLVFDLLATAIFAAALITSLQYNRLQGLVPSIFCSITLVMMIAILVSRFARGPQDDVAENVVAGRAGVWFVCYAVAIIGVGFYVAIPVFTFLYLRQEAQLKYWQALLFTACASLLLYGAFVKILYVHPWVGLVPELVAGYVGGGIAPPL
jgi:hypothetical protein